MYDVTIGTPVYSIATVQEQEEERETGTGMYIRVPTHITRGVLRPLEGPRKDGRGVRSAGTLIT